MSEKVDLTTIKPIVVDNVSGMGSIEKPDKTSGVKNPIDIKIGQPSSANSDEDVSLHKNSDKFITDNPKLIEYGIDLNKPFTVTKEMIQKMKSKGKKGFWESLKDGAKNAIPFLSGAMEIKKSIELIAITKKQQNGEKLSKDETEKLYTYLFEQVETEHRGSSFMGKVGEMLSHLPAFAGEFFCTGGLYSAGNKLALKASAKVLGQVTKKQIAKTFIKKAAAVTTGAAVRSVALSSTYAGIVARRTELDTSKLKQEKVGDETILTGEIGIKENDESWSASICKGLADGFIESLSEQSGAAVMSPLGKIPVFGKFLVPPKGSQKFLSSIGYHGLLEEYAEERFGGFLRGAIGLDTDKNKGYFENLYNSTVPSLEQTGVELTTTAIWGGAMTSANIVYNSKPVTKARLKTLEKFEQSPVLREIKHIKQMQNRATNNLIQIDEKQKNKKILTELSKKIKEDFKKYSYYNSKKIISELKTLTPYQLKIAFEIYNDKHYKQYMADTIQFIKNIKNQESAELLLAIVIKF